MTVVRRMREMTAHVWRSVVVRDGSVRRVRGVAHRVAITGMRWVLVVRTVVRVRRRCVHRTGRCPRAWVRRVAIARTSVHGWWLVVSSVRVARRSHGSTSDSRNSALLLNSRFWVHALFWADVAKLRVVGRLHKMLRLLRRSRVVADQMKVLAVVGGDGEGLLHEAVRFVAVAIGSAVGVLVVGCLGGIAAGILVETARATSLALHLTVGQETSRDTAGAPGLAVSPSAHARLALIPDKHRARLDRLPLLLRQTSLHSREKTDATCLEENDGIRRRANVAVVSLHCA
jgi:hypothetical protein